MAIPVEQFQPETFAQANPMLTGFLTVAQALPQIQQQQYQNQILAQQAPYAGQLAQAQLATAQQQAPYMQAQIQDILQGVIPQQQAQAAYMSQGLTPEAIARAQLTGAQGQMAQQVAGIYQQQPGFAVPSPIAQYGAALQWMAQNDPQTFQMMTGQSPQQVFGGAQGQGQPQTGIPPTISRLPPSALSQAPAMTSPTGQPLPQQPLTITPQQALQQTQAAGIQTSVPGQMGATSPAQLMALRAFNPAAYQAYQKGAETTAAQNVLNWNKQIDEANDQTNIANQLENALGQYSTNYDKSTYKGSALGTTKTTGWKSAFLGDMSPEQQTDAAANTMAFLYGRALVGGRITNYELQNVSSLKPTRTLDSDAEQQSVDFWNAKSQRLREEPTFMLTARNMGLDPQTASTLWQQYNNQRPVYNFHTNEAYNNFQGSWRDYLSPQTIQAAQTGQEYVPMPNFSSSKDLSTWYATLPQNDRDYVKGYVQQRGGNI